MNYNYKISSNSDFFWHFSVGIFYVVPSCKYSLTNFQFHYGGKHISDNHLLRTYFLLISPFEIKIMIKARKLR